METKTFKANEDTWQRFVELCQCRRIAPSRAVREFVEQAVGYEPLLDLVLTYPLDFSVPSVMLEELGISISLSKPRYRCPECGSANPLQHYGTCKLGTTASS